MTQAHLAILCHSTVKISPIVVIALLKTLIKLVFCERVVLEMNSVMMALTAYDPMDVMTIAKRLPMAPAEQSMAQATTIVTMAEMDSPEDQRASAPQVPSLPSPMSPAHIAGPGPALAPTAEVMLVVMLRNCGVGMEAQEASMVKIAIGERGMG